MGRITSSLSDIRYWFPSYVYHLLLWHTLRYRFMSNIPMVLRSFHRWYSTNYSSMTWWDAGMLDGGPSFNPTRELIIPYHMCEPSWINVLFPRLLTTSREDLSAALTHIVSSLVNTWTVSTELPEPLFIDTEKGWKLCGLFLLVQLQRCWWNNPLVIYTNANPEDCSNNLPLIRVQHLWTFPLLMLTIQGAHAGHDTANNCSNNYVAKQSFFLLSSSYTIHLPDRTTAQLLRRANALERDLLWSCQLYLLILLLLYTIPDCTTTYAILGIDYS